MQVPAVGAEEPVGAAAVLPNGIVPDYSLPGPLLPMRLPRLEHTCSSCFPRCSMNRCLIKLDVWYPKGGLAVGLSAPYPLAIFTAGFVVDSRCYQSYAQMLASWGYTVVLYDKVETFLDSLDDDVSVRFILDIINWAEQDPLMQRLADPSCVYLVGHSRGGKLAALAAAADERIAALCLIDPVDNTIYAPLGPGFPSAVAALRSVPPSRALPIAIVGSGMGGDCVPKEANHERFFAAAPSVAWDVLLADAGHFQFLDYQNPLQKAICGKGMSSDATVKRITQCCMVAWGECMLRGRSGADPLRLGYNEQGEPRAGFASLERARALFGTEARIERLLRDARVGGGDARVEYRLKNIDLLPAAATAGPL